MSNAYQQFQIRRGLKADLPILAQGELAYCTDTKEFFIGDGVANSYIGFIPAAAGDWNGTAPADLKNAVDRLAAAVAGLLGGPIP